MMNYLLANNLLSTKQYGFIKNILTSLQLLQVMDKWTKYLEYGGQVDVMYSDFEKAFDKVPHKRLSSKAKLISYGLNSAFINWIQDFLKAESLELELAVVFTACHNARIVSAVLAMAIPSVCPSVCLSVTRHQPSFYATPNFLIMGIKYLNLSYFIQVSTIKDEKSAAKFHYIKTVSGKVVAQSIAFRVVSIY